MPFEVGSVVVLNSGGYPMTVTNVHKDFVSTAWIDTQGRLQRDEFHILEVRTAPEPPD